MVNAEPLVALRYEAEDPIESLDSILRSCRATEDLRRRARLSGGANLKELVQIDLLRKVAGDILIRRVLGSRHRSAPVRSCIVAALGPHHRPNLRRCQMAIPDRFKQRLMCRCARQSCKAEHPAAWPSACGGSPSSASSSGERARSRASRTATASSAMRRVSMFSIS